jgi:hypothetical protein
MIAPGSPQATPRSATAAGAPTSRTAIGSSSCRAAITALRRRISLASDSVKQAYDDSAKSATPSSANGASQTRASSTDSAQKQLLTTPTSSPAARAWRAAASTTG